MTRELVSKSRVKKLLTTCLDFANERFHIEKRKQSFAIDTCNLAQEFTIITFDGKKVKCHSPREKNLGLSPKQPEMGIVTGNVKNEIFLLECKPIFFAHGRIYTPMEPIVPGQMRNKPDPNYLHIHGAAVFEGRPCLIVRTQTLQLSTISFEEYWVDPERDSTIVRYSSYSGTKPTFDQDMVIHYKYLPEGWFASDWHWTFFEHGRMLNYEDMHITKVKINPVVSDPDFDLESQTGMIVSEVERHASTGPFTEPRSDASYYRVEENGKRTYLPNPFGNSDDQYYKKRAQSNLLPWLFFSIAAMLTALWIWVRLRSKKKRA